MTVAPMPRRRAIARRRSSIAPTAAALRYASLASSGVSRAHRHDVGVTHPCDEDEVVAHHHGKRRQQRLGDDGLGELGQDHDERAAPEARHRLGERGAVVALRELCVEVVHRVGDAAELRAAPRWGHDGAHRPAEREQPGAITESGAHRRHHHHRVHRVLETGHALDPARHHSPAVEEEQHRLVAFGAIRADDELPRARGRGPVDPPELVVGRVLAQLIELGARARGPARIAVRPRGCGRG